LTIVLQKSGGGGGSRQ